MKRKRNKKGQFVKAIKARYYKSRVYQGVSELNRARLEKQAHKGNKKSQRKLDRMDYQDYLKRKREYMKNKRKWDIATKYT